MKRQTYRPALAVSLVGIMAAMLECIKLALSFLPNIEALTLFTALFGYAFGWLGIAASVVFVMIEPLIYGFGSWTISYFLYWPFVAFTFMMLRRLGVKGRIIPTLVAALSTLWFGVLTSLVDVGLLMGVFDNFFYRLSILYARGIVFYALQLGCNIVLFLLLFPFFSNLLIRLRRSVFTGVKIRRLSDRKDGGEDKAALSAEGEGAEPIADLSESTTTE